MSTTDQLSEIFSWREKQGSRSGVCITFFCFAELQPKFTGKPPNPLEVLEGSNISLKWGYDVGGASIKRVEFREVTSSPLIRIVEADPEGQTPVDVHPDYVGRVQVNVTTTNTSIMIFEANRTVDSKDYEFEVVLPSGSNLPASLVTISVQCKYNHAKFSLFSVT